MSSGSATGPDVRPATLLQVPPDDTREAPDPREPLNLLFRDLRTSSDGLSEREARHRQTVYGPNALSRRGGRQWPRELAQQFTHPLAVLLALAAVLRHPHGGWLAPR
ncbi:cation-transporting P-type ATPase [Kitasatospora sp. NPDC058965]|uniref:cation-transporting P-type ATPase n=1 Tax=Kitasatospora sp. NPDC058965 TaxID=3346682 RepID=UPI0036CCE78B